MKRIRNLRIWALFVMLIAFSLEVLANNTDYYSRVTAEATGVGKVYVSYKDETTNPDYKEGTSSAESGADSQNSEPTHTYYLYAQAGEGYSFTGWSGDDTSTDIPFKVTVIAKTNVENATKKYTAHFVKNATNDGEDKSSLIENPNANNGTNGWTANEYATFRVAENGSFEVASWGIGYASMEQTIHGIPNGYYLLQAKTMAPVGNTLELWGNETNNSYTATAQQFQDLGVVVHVTNGELTIKAVNNNAGAWSNFDDFTLTYFGEEMPSYSYSVGRKLEGSQISKPAYVSTPGDATVDPDHANDALLVITYADNYTNDPKVPYTLKEGAKATITADGGVNVEVNLIQKFRSTKYESGFALYIPDFDESKTYHVTIPEGSFGYIGKSGNATNEAFTIDAVASPLRDGKYFVVVDNGDGNTDGKHVSRGGHYGTQAILDYYGVPLMVQTAGLSVFKYIDSNAFFGHEVDAPDNLIYADKNGVTEAQKIRRYDLIVKDANETDPAKARFKFYTPLRDKYLGYEGNELKELDGDGAWFKFEPLADYDQHLATIEEDEAIRVAARAGFVVKNKTEYDELIDMWESKGFTNIFPSNDTEATKAAEYHEKKNAELACDADWAGTPRDLVGSDKVSLTLAKGLYVMDCDAFQQAMNLATLQANQGFRGLTYMYVKVGNEMYKSQLKSITETDGSIPTDEASAKTALDAGTYRNQVIFYVPANGTQVEFGVENPQRLGNGIDENAGSWVAFKNIYIEKFNAVLDEANLTCKAGKYGTFVAPFDVRLPNEIIAMEVTKEQDDRIIVTQIALDENNTLTAGTPVIVKNTSDTDIIDKIYRDVKDENVGDAKTVTDGTGTLTGALVAGQDVPTGSFVLQTQKYNTTQEGTEQELQAFYIVVKEKPFTATKNRCYVNAVNPSQSNVKVFNIVENDDATGIVEVEKTNNKPETTVIYDLSGRRVNVAQKGIYIINGKKVVVK